MNRSITPRRVALAVGGLLAGGAFGVAQAITVTIATVNNGDMVRMQKLAGHFTDAHPDIELEWVTLEENILRQRVTTDIATDGGQYDVMTIGTYEVPIWGKQGWLEPLDGLPDYDYDDLLEPIRNGLTVEDKLYAVPFYGESSMIMYRTDLFEEAGLEMPQEPTWAFIGEAARKIDDRDNGRYGICLRGKAGWGENTALLTATANSFGARWFDENWEPQLDSPEWEEAFGFYLDLMDEAGPPGASTNGFNENLALFQTGKCGIWMDATVAASFVTNPEDSEVADTVGFALAPGTDNGDKRANWLWAWSLAIPAGSDAVDAAKTFVAWATSKAYLEIVAEEEGWANVPPGTRRSLYENAEYQKVPFAQMTLESIMAADPNRPTVDPVPYVGVQFVAIPEFQAIGTSVGQQFAAALAGDISGTEALESAQELTRREMIRAGYLEQ